MRRWAIVVATACPIAGAGCGVGTMGGVPACDEAVIDPDFGGCFTPADSPGVGRIDIEQYECNLLTGTGEGLTDLLGAGFEAHWNLSGEVDASGHARLFIHLWGESESVFVEAFQGTSASGEVVLNLRRPLILTPMELIPCS